MRRASFRCRRMRVAGRGRVDWLLRVGNRKKVKVVLVVLSICLRRGDTIFSSICSSESTFLSLKTSAIHRPKGRKTDLSISRARPEPAASARMSAVRTERRSLRRLSSSLLKKHFRSVSMTSKSSDITLISIRGGILISGKGGMESCIAKRTRISCMPPGIRGTTGLPQSEVSKIPPLSFK